MKNMLVTGGAGFIGSNFIRYMLEHEPDVHIVNLDALTYAGDMSNLEDLPDPDRHIFVKGDICYLPTVSYILGTYKIDTIVNFAAETHVDQSIYAPECFMTTNVMGAFTLLEAVRMWYDSGKRPIRFHHVSTDEVYGSLDPLEAPWTEDSKYAPNSPYSASKAASDYLVRAYGHTYGTPYTITNCSNNYGPRQHLEKLIPLTITRALRWEKIPIYGDGRQIRDWIYVDDHCEALKRVLEAGVSGETYNIGGDNQTANIELVETICGVLDKVAPVGRPYSQLVEHVADRPGHDYRYAVNAGKIRKEFGWQPKISLKEGIALTVKWYMEHKEWVEAIRNKVPYKEWLKQQYGGK